MIKQHEPVEGGGKKLSTNLPRKQPDRQMIFFDADTIVAGIVFHLADEGIGSAVDTTSLLALRRRLKRGPAATPMKRARWAAMPNPQRLEWLLAVSESCFQVGDDATVVIAHRR